jgi:hypothetical protein
MRFRVESGGWSLMGLPNGLGELAQVLTRLDVFAASAWGRRQHPRAYDSSTGFLSSLTYPTTTTSSSDALQLQYGYQNGELRSITDVSDAPNVPLWQANTTNARGQVTQETLGNGIVTSRAYNAVTAWLGNIQSGVGGGASVQNQSFFYDGLGNVIQRQDNTKALNENFYYDGVNRLMTTTLNGTQNSAFR